MRINLIRVSNPNNNALRINNEKKETNKNYTPHNPCLVLRAKNAWNA